MKTKKEIQEKFKKNVDFILDVTANNKYADIVKVFQRACALYWVLDGEGDFHIKIFPKLEIDHKRLNAVLNK